MGRKPILDALNDNLYLEKIWIDRMLTGPFEIELRQKCREKKIPLSHVPIEKLNKLSNYQNHQGVFAFSSPIEFHNIEDIIPHLFEQGKSPKVLILDGVEDVRNFAAISRSAVWFGFDAILVSIKKAAPVNYVSVKVSAGAITKIPICREHSIMHSTQFLKDSGFKIYGADMHGESPKNISMQAPLAIIMGAESKGINRELKALCDQIVTIEGSGQIDSLNVSVAAALLMGEVFNLTTG